MKIILETERLFLRELVLEDQQDLFELDSDPEVHRYIEQKPVKSMDEIVKVIEMLQNQYKENGIARWAVIDKKSNECVGWSGLKYFNQSLNSHTHFYELGYRFKQKHWGKGFATESARAILNHGFQELNIKSIYAITHPKNSNSKHVLQKLGFKFIEVFDYDGDPTCWFELTKSDWDNSLLNFET